MRAIVFLLTLLPCYLPAQTDDAPGIPRLTLKTNAGILINPFKQAFGFATDIRLSRRISADIGAGAFFNSAAFANNKGESYRGMRLRAGIKYFLIQSERNAFHVGLEGKYHDIKNIQIREVFRQGQQYLQFYPVERKVRTKGIALRAGWQFYLGAKKRFFIEPYTGLGVLFHDVHSGLPPDATLVGDDVQEFFPLASFEYGEGKSTTPDVLLGLHCGIALW